MILHDDTLSGAEGKEGVPVLVDVVASVITTSSQDGRDGEAGVNVVEGRQKGMIKSASL
jgi:hypothetical protein